MKIKTKEQILIITNVALINTCVFGAGYQVAEHSATGLGRAFSGEAAIADNASVLGNNPAAITKFDNKMISSSFTAIMPSINVYDSTINQSANNVAPNAYIPTAYYINPISDKLIFGLALFSSYGVSTDYSAEFSAGLVAGETSLLTYNVNPNMAYKLSEKWSLGAGLSVVYSTAKLDRYWGGDVTPENVVISMEGNSYSLGWNIGALYEVNDNNRFGFSYRSQVDVNLEGDFTDYTGSITGADNIGKAVSGELPIILPAIAEFSGFHQFDATNWALHYSLQWTQFSKLDELRATSGLCNADASIKGVCFYKDENYQDTYRFAIGSTYQLDQHFILRAGLAYDQHAGEPTVSIPDSDRYWYSAGTTYSYSDNLSFDFGIAYVQSSKIKFEEDTSPNNIRDITRHNFSSTGNAWIMSAQINYIF
jgi:long-chain fatty acid transport protein